MRLVTALNTSAASDLKVERDEFASILMKIGLKRNVAKVLTYLAGVDRGHIPRDRDMDRISGSLR